MRISFAQRSTAIISLILFVLSLSFSAQGFVLSQQLSDALNAVAQGGGDEAQKALLFSQNHLINKMRINQHISQQAYDVVQRQYAEISQRFATEAAMENGADLHVQTRDPTRPFDAGTDSDYITNATSAEQVRRMQKTYNAKVKAYLNGNGITETADWVKVHDVDFMADPAHISPEEFQKVSLINNDAYIDPLAASAEAKHRAGETPTFEEALAYNDEMRRFIDKKARQVAERSQNLQELMANRDTRAPVDGGTDVDAYNEKQHLEAEIQQKQAHKAKYFNRIQNGNEFLARHLDVDAPDGTALTRQAMIRALPSEVGSAKHQKITTALADSATGQLRTQTNMNQARLLALMASRNPARAPEYSQKIQQMAADLPPSQKGELITLLEAPLTRAMRDNQGTLVRDRQGNVVHEVVRYTDTDTIRNLVDDMRQRVGDVTQVEPGGQNEGVSAAGSQMGSLRKGLHTAGGVVGKVGDVMGVYEKLQKAEQGNHLFINIGDDDSEVTKFVKRAGVTALELYDVPIIDAFDTGWNVDEKIKKQILENIRTGKHTSEYAATGWLFYEVSSTLVANMWSVPSIVEGAVEGHKTVRDMWKNWKAEDHREESLQMQQRKFSEIVARINLIKLGAITGKRTTTSGEVRYDLNNVDPDDNLSFEIPRTEIWTDHYETQWEVQHSTTTKLYSSKRLSATDPAANSFAFNGSLPAGKYTVVIRVFDKESGKQMDASAKALTVGDTISFGQLQVVRKEAPDKAFTGSAKINDILVFRVSRLGKWDNSHYIEWLVNGESHKNLPAADPDSAVFLKRFSDMYDPGFYTVAVRAIDKETGAIEVHDRFALQLEPGTSATKLLGDINITLSQGSDFDRGSPVVSGHKLTSREGKLWAVSSVMFPESSEPQQVRVFWELLDGQNNVLSAKEEIKEGTGGSAEVLTKIPVGKLQPGLYTMRLSQALVAHPEEKSEAHATFTVYEPVRITNQWVTTKPGDTENKTRLFSWNVPHLYVTFEAERELGSVLTEITVIDQKTGTKIHSMVSERPIDPEKAEQRTGIALPDGQVKPGDTVTFVVTISPAPTGTESFQPVTASMDFSVISADLVVKVKKIVVGNGPGRYSITAPEGFERPFTVRISGGGLEVNQSSDPLRGTFRGRESTSDSVHTMSFAVTDVKGRNARGTAKVTVKGLDARTMASKNRPQQQLSRTPHRVEPAFVQQPVNQGPDLVEQLQGIAQEYMNQKKRIQDDERLRKEKYKATMREIDNQYRTPPPTPDWMNGGNQNQTSQPRSFAIDASSCQSSFNSCMQRCPTSGSASTISNCHMQCGNANKTCTSSKCPGGSVSGTGWNLTCTIR